MMDNLCIQMVNQGLIEYMCMYTDGVGGIEIVCTGHLLGLIG